MAIQETKTIQRKQGIQALRPIKDITKEDILVNLMVGDEDLDLKTRIENPTSLAFLWTYGEVLNGEKYVESSEVLKIYINKLLRYYVSLRGLGREGILKAVASLYDKETVRMSISERLTSNLAKK